MKFKIPVLVLLWTFGFSSSAYACTSFVLYGNEIFYGMNFDYFSIPLKFLIESRLGMNIFHLSFLYDQTVDDPEYKGYFAKTCGVNNKGLFCASQEIEPHIEGRKKADKYEVHIDDQYEAISRYSGVEQVKKKIKGKQWIQYIGPSIHNLFADINGNAIVTETDNKENFITEIENNFMVMSNFANHSLAGKSYKATAGVGVDRYITAYDHILKNIGSFSIDKGFELLKKASLRNLDCSTLCSMIFHPQTNHIYIALHQDFEKVWKVSLDSKIIETYRGHDKYFQTRLGEDGILAIDLESFGSYNSGDTILDFNNKNARLAVSGGTVIEKLFVYGTLGPGRPHEHVLEAIGGSWETATVKGTLRHEGWGSELGYPGIDLNEHGGVVQGFLFTSENLSGHWAALDKFEGDAYERVLTEVKLKDGSLVDAYIYTLRSA